jgi:hypothetical protein
MLASGANPSVVLGIDATRPDAIQGKDLRAASKDGGSQRDRPQARGGLPDRLDPRSDTPEPGEPWNVSPAAPARNAPPTYQPPFPSPATAVTVPASI